MSKYKFNDNQIAIIEKLGLNSNTDDLEKLFSSNDHNLKELEILLKVANALYRSGYPIIEDDKYDEYLSYFKTLDPENPFLLSVEPEVLIDSKTVPLPKKMLSTDKAYSFDEIKKWTERITKAASEIEFDQNLIEIRVTPKLDGYAAYDDGITLYTRGDGVRGQDITRAFERGLKVAKNAGRGLGAGEIVINKSYFDEVLSEKFENSRNIQAAIIAEKKVDEDVQNAIDEGACVFYPFSLLDNWIGSIEDLLSNFESILERIWNSVDFDIDGLVLETTNVPIKEHMGSTRKFHRWQIAFKVNDESAEVEVLRVVPQTSRTGRVSPVAELVPTKLSGATLSRATVHHYRMVKANGVGPGAIIKLVRSGLVIPKIEEVIKPAEPELPENCPSCGAHLIWEGDHLICPNKSDCPAQTENTLIHFFKTLGNVDGFGPKVIEKIANQGVKHIHEIYQIPKHQFIEFGFGDKTSQNLIHQLEASREIEIEDWRFLAAFGVSRLAGGNCEKLLQHHAIVQLFEISVEDMVRIDGFAELSAEAIVEGLSNVREEFFKVYNLGFNLSVTPKESERENSDSPIAGAVVVFTGSMQQGSRDDMEKNAKALGAKVAKSVTSKTTYLVTGDKVGETKINAARDKGVKVLTEQEYLNLIE
ncbi:MULTISPECIES: BRCT domain-containing protein [Acinetobacter calcoaceticus/baumannii complex]|uniref:BRCT domain-containing protein n=1 Tax=Acinetobacter calcoaceticus/baumannii complex TaxID=909768 RepID=UPI00029DF54A|nr:MULTISPECIES: BRCT domain-containing protein [Acinetobacter calcoaceticus/baumannii complex]QNB03265.1 DNA ligase [Acinetobacter baumannii]EKU54995.1 NAD-dependent DNA ligase domain protein [Acinetobacter sp. WC-323]MCY3236131.1 DNA ligase [Acinetobacter pittii]MCY3288865.1 DNA ligase [Acinetobacter pittii]MCY3296982.1 DNA ligase [Acinetobacter pittii]